uniref:SHC-transforming protein 4 isoform X2 n=1 Tax=Geotrypetes seraphini TaxID=260995 RepID=A0A6P8NJC7_GEOSA|nr:SHC-transforming protein 4 isoform X2 [Geotrypetes seraphini]
MLHRAKYSRFRDDAVTSVEDGTPLNAKGSSSASNGSLNPDLPIGDHPSGHEDGGSALCTLLPKMASIKLSNPSGLLSLRHFALGAKEVPRVKLRERNASPSSLPSPEIGCISCVPASESAQDLDAKPKAQDEFRLPEAEETPLAKQQDRHTLHKTESFLEAGMTYYVRYMGCIEVLQSMRSLDFGTRTQVTREAISRLCEAVPGTKGAMKKRKPPVKFLSSVLGKSNLQFSGMSITLTVSTNNLTLTSADTQQDTADYVAYVAKDPVNQRACHIVECSDDMAEDVINTIGHAFELRFKQYLKSPSAPMVSHESEEMTLEGSIWNLEVKEEHEYYNEIPGKQPPTGGLSDMRMKVQTMEQRPTCLRQIEKQYCLTCNPKCTNIYENCLEHHKMTGLPGERSLKTKRDAVLLTPTCRADLFDDPCYMNTQTHLSLSVGVTPMHGCLLHQAKLSEAAHPRASSNTSMCGLPQLTQQLKQEDWFHGKLSRKAAECLLVNDGDFLVRESVTSLCQYVLSGLQGGQAKHLLLVDPEGKVRTRDHIFDSVSHLIHYHVENQLPIISSGSELCLKQPIRKPSNPTHGR